MDKVLNFIDEKEDITDVNYMETEANSEDEYLDNNDLMLVSKKMDNLNYKNNIKTTKNKNDKNDTEEDSIENLKVDNNTKMFQFGLHNVNDDFFNRVKKDNKIVSILSELNSNNTKKKTGSLSEASSDIEDDIKQKKKEVVEKEVVQKVNVAEKKRGSSINDIINDLKLSQQNEEDEEDDEDDEEDEDDENDENDEEDEGDEDDEDDEDDKSEGGGGKKNYSETSNSDDIKFIKPQNSKNGMSMKR